MASGDDLHEAWPALPLDEWRATYETLHMWLQTVGKVKLALTPYLNEWWNAAFTITARGMTTSTIPFGNRVFEIDFNFIDHRLDLHVNDGTSSSIALFPRSVADFYQELMSALRAHGIDARINTHPVEVENTIPFDQDHQHASYEPEPVNRCWRILVQVDRVLQYYRSPFVGKSSPVQFWWGSFDLAEVRFSGRPAPPRAWPRRWMALAAHAEQALAGFWPGNDQLREPAFVAYTTPEPPSWREATIRPDAAYFHPQLGEYVMPYEAVRGSADPDRMILDFYTNAYEIGATLGGWDRAALERHDFAASARTGRKP